ncbi:CaiB/BaiF CoA-transferase family protein [uncultured Roseobacter sp.]|uniref:CaiB/BaiF CoA transferase family protein n=1 Tax=uncultured Roseobacter sp. TaxID=114847 RepID=UPI00262AA9C8|nr:CoA transferase [uncultured Roseobacter sp.]
MAAPLQGIRVIDWTHVLAGPACAYYLGLLGAEVIKVERPGRGDAIRHRGGTDRGRAAEGMSTAYLTQAAGKQCLAVDLGTDTGRAVFHRLLASADVLVENHRLETLKRLRLTESDTRALNPRLVHCAMTGYGRGNDMSDAPAYDVNIQAISGLMALTGTQDSGPMRTGAPVIDYATGLAGALGVMSALMTRAASGTGSFVDVSMLETAFTLMSSTVTDHMLTGVEPSPRGNAANSRSPSAGVFPCKEGYISLGVNEPTQFTALAQALDRAAWLRDPRFATVEARGCHAEALDQALSARLKDKDASTWEEVLMAARVPCAKLRKLGDAVHLPPVAQRHYTTRGAAGFPGLPFALDGTAHGSDVAPKRIGADTDTILDGLGYNAEEISAMRANGSVGGPSDDA